MALQITIDSSPSGVSNSVNDMTFSEQGGTIGRSADCAWALDDPERFLSGLHCEISFNGSGFILIDNSTNGTFFNGNPEPIGKGGSVPLADGDMIEVGDYKLKVSLWGVTGAAEAVAAPDPFAAPISDPFADLSTASLPDNNDHFSDPFASPSSDFGDNSFSLGAEPEETDPLAALGQSSTDPFGNASGASDPFGGVDDFGGDAITPGSIDDFLPGASASPLEQSAPDPFAGASSSMSGASDLNDSITWPQAKAENHIPEDWGSDFDFMADEPAPSMSPQQPIPQEPIPQQPISQEPIVPAPERAPAPSPTSAAGQKPRPGRVNPEPAPNLGQTDIERSMPLTAPLSAPQAPIAESAPEPQPSYHTASAHAGANDGLIAAMGLKVEALTEAQKQEINHQVGSLMRDVVGGMMQMLRSRASIKNEFRMDVTTIQPAENNPLKFSVDVDEALENMFVRKSPAYKKADEAFNEGFSGIAEHQMAIIAGIREAFEGMIERFNPETLESQFNIGSKGSILPGSKNAKSWVSYQKFYADLQNNMDNSFRFLFGDEFVQAYEEQLQKLVIARKQKQL